MSVRRDGGYVRSQRLLLIAREIAKEFSVNKECNVERLKLDLLMVMGLTEKTLTEYISVVCRAKGWLIQDGIITPGALE